MLQVCKLTDINSPVRTNYAQQHPNVERTYLMSEVAFTKAVKSAKRNGYTFGGHMRRRAGLLVRSDNPQFNVSGAPLSRYVRVGLSDSTYEALVAFCISRAIPTTAIAEIIASLI